MGRTGAVISSKGLHLASVQAEGPVCHQRAADSFHLKKVNSGLSPIRNLTWIDTRTRDAVGTR